MVTRQELIESDFREVNKQLYDSHKRIMVLTDKVTELEKTIANQQKVINGLAAG